MNEMTIRHAVDIASAYVSHNHIRAEELTALIGAIHVALADLDKVAEPAAEKPKPAVDLPWKKTIRPEYLISLVDGKRYRTLRRHLSTRGLTPDEYRACYDLPKDYPMVAPAYSERRSTIAKANGLGRMLPGAGTAAAIETKEARSVVKPATAAPTDEQASVGPASRRRRRAPGKKVAEVA